MKFIASTLQGVVLIQPEPTEDFRGIFGRTFCEHEFEGAGIPTRFVQSGFSYNHQRGTLRGMHYQTNPHPEGKLVRCTRGSIFDVALDLRKGSSTYLKWYGVELSAQNHQAIWIPEGFAHGFQTLSDETEIYYQMTEFYDPTCARGVRFDDPAFGIQWPLAQPIILERDRTYPNFDMGLHS